MGRVFRDIKGMEWQNIRIQNVNRGFIAEVGCQTFGFGDSPSERRRMVTMFTEYMCDPKAARDKYVPIPPPGRLQRVVDPPNRYPVPPTPNVAGDATMPAQVDTIGGDLSGRN